MALEQLPRIEYAFLCEDVRREIGEKNSYMGVFSKFHVDDFEKPLRPFYVVCLWLFDDQSPKKLIIRLADEDGADIRKRVELETPHLEGERNEYGAYGLNFHFGIPNLKLEGPGKYFVIFKLGEREIKRVPFLVVGGGKEG